MKTRILIACLLLSAATAFCAEQLTQGAFTEVVKDVSIVSAATKSAVPAKANDVLKSPDSVRTGADSRAELVAPDHTTVRVGASSSFAFGASGREINLEQGSLLFHAPGGKGGGSIKSGGASASVTGTTIMVAAAPASAANAQGGFKVIDVEGTAKVKLGNGRTTTLKAGQMIFIMPGQTKFGPVLDINLEKLVAGSTLINGFASPLPSLALINQAIIAQNKDIAKGRAIDTGISADNFAQQRNLPGNAYGSIDVNNFQIGAAGALIPVQAQPQPFPTEPPPAPGPRGGGSGNASGLTLEQQITLIEQQRLMLHSPNVSPIIPVGSGGVTWALQWDFMGPFPVNIIISKDKNLQVILPAGPSLGASSGQPSPPIIPITPITPINGGSSGGVVVSLPTPPLTMPISGGVGSSRSQGAPTSAPILPVLPNQVR